MSAYTGRLAFDPETKFHVDPDGKAVVTDDEGKTWRYAVTASRWRRNTKPDKSHNARYEKQTVIVDSTANELATLAFEHGSGRAAELIEPHHFEVQVHDAHFSGIQSDPDAIAETITSHTEAYRG